MKRILKPQFTFNHFTTVVAKDGNSLVTCEVNREYQETSTERPWFNIYDTEDALMAELNNIYTVAMEEQEEKHEEPRQAVSRSEIKKM